MLPTLPAISLRFITVDFSMFIISGLVFIRRNVGGHGYQKNRSNSRAQCSDAAKQQYKQVEQAFASSGNQSMLGHRFAPVSSYSALIIARTEGGRWPAQSPGT
jgi:hypothetical protein